MTWYLNRALSNFRSAVNARWPDRDKTSDGTIGDLAHQATSSDHNPDVDGSVDAWDMDVDLGSGDDPAMIEHLKQVFQAHEASRYWIHNRRIASRPDGWVRRDYDGANPHDHHVHWNTRETYEDSTDPWVLGEDDDMPTVSEIWSATWGSSEDDAGERLAMAAYSSRQAVAELQRQKLVQEAILTKVTQDDVELAAIKAHIDAKVAEIPQPPTAVQIAAAVLAALPASGPVSREDLEAALRTVLGSVDNTPTS